MTEKSVWHIVKESAKSPPSTRDGVLSTSSRKIGTGESSTEPQSLSST
jgi:hypothetical protein